MKRSIRSLFSAVVLMSLAGLASRAAAEAPPPPKGPLTGYVRCLGVLNLTDDQKTQVRGVLDAAKPNLVALGQKLKTDGAALKALTDAATPDACAVGNALLLVKADGKAIADTLKVVHQNVEAVLTAEQKLRFEGCLAAHHPRGAAAVAAIEEEGSEE